jgi:hypothetical protein
LTTRKGAIDDSAIRKNSKELIKKEGPSVSPSKADPHFLTFWVTYTAGTGVPVNSKDQGQAEAEWNRLGLADRIAAVRFLPQLPDDRPPNRYPLPANYLARQIWTRTSLRTERPEPRGLRAEEIE